MSLKNRKSKALLAGLSLLVLVGCDTTKNRYPSNYTDPFLGGEVTDKNNDKVPTALDTLKDYYSSLTNDDAVYEKLTKKLLTTLSSNVHDIDKEGADGKGSATYHVVNTDTNNVSVSYGETLPQFATDDVNENLEVSAKDSMFAVAKTGSYEKDNVFNEYKYAEFLRNGYYYLADDSEYALNTNEDDLTKVLITPEMKYDDVYSSVNEKAYAKYRTHELYDDEMINYLTAEYLYKKSYSSIGNSNARKVQVIAIADRSDEIGDAKQLIDAYVADYIMGDKAGSSFVDKDFNTLTKLWKGLTVEALSYLYGSGEEIEFAETATGYTYSLDASLTEDEKKDVKKFFARYLVTLADDGSVVIDPLSQVLTLKDAKWLAGENAKNVNIVNNRTSDTLIGKVMKDVKTLRSAEGPENWHKIDSSLESTYTGSYTHDVATGIRMAIDDIVTRSFVTEGTYLKGSGISAIPSAVSDRVFSPKISTAKADIDEMKAHPGLKKDLTVFENDNHRYLTVADTLSTDDNNIVYYDASSKTYYITRLLDAVDTYALSSSGSMYDTDEKKKQVALEVAFAMATTGTYKSDSNIYWLSRLDWSFFDDAYLEYVKSNYKDIFKTESSYRDEAKIDLTKFNA